MTKRDRKNLEAKGLREVKTAGFTATKAVKRDKTVNRRAGLHDKLKNLRGEARVKRCKPLALKHVRRMRKVAAVASIGVVGAVSVFGVGFLMSTKDIQLDGEFETVCYVAPTDGTKPTDHTLVENVGYMNYVLQNQLLWSSHSRTDVNAVAMGVPAKQWVDNYKQYYNDVLISADCSFSGVSKLLQYGEQFCQANGVVLSRYSTSSETADLEKGMDAPWSTDPASGWTIKGFKANRGLPPYDFSVYVLNELTIANAYDYTVVDNYDGTYSMSLTLNTNTGVAETSADYYYRLQMQKNGGLNDLPTIYYTTLTYTFDENWRVLKLEVDDSYTAKAVGMNSDCTSHTVTEYYYDEESAKNTFWEGYFQAEYERQKDTLIDEGVESEGPVDNAFNYLSMAFGSVLTDGAVFKVDLNIYDLDLNGVVNVEMADGDFSGLSAKLGDILVWLDGNTLYVNDGSAKYKLDIKALTAGSEESGEESGVSAQGLTDGLDLTALMDQMTSGEFVLNGETGVATLNSELELFGLKISLAFEFQKTEDGVVLNFLNAEIPLGEKVVKAKLCFGTEDDKPAIPENVLDYQDVLNEGITLDIALNANGLKLEGNAKIVMQDGKFTGVCAYLGDIAVYYDCPHNMLYLSTGDVKYKLNISTLNSGNKGTSALSDSLDINPLLKDILANLTTTENSLGTRVNIDALGSVINAALNIQLNGGIAVGADLSLDNLNVKLSAKLSNSKVTLPTELDSYQDILNDGVTLEIALNVNDLKLEGVAKIIMQDGKFTGVYADLGGVSVYYDVASNTLYLKSGDAKYKLDLYKIGGNGKADLTAIFGSLDTETLIDEILANLTAGESSLSSSLNMTVLENVFTAAVKIQLNGGLKANADLTFGGIKASISVALTNKQVTLPKLTEYVDILNDGIAFDISLTVGELALNGTAKILMQEGAFAGVYADLGGISVYFDSAWNTLYLKSGDAKYKLDLSEISANGGNTDLTAIFGSLDIETLISDILANLTTGESSLSSSFNITVLEKVLTAAVNVQLNGGLKVNADLTFGGIKASIGVALSNKQVTLPKLTEYVDILRDGVTLDVTLKVNGLTLDGIVKIIMERGAFVGVYADLDAVSVYFDNDSNTLYLKAGNLRYKLGLSELGGKSEAGLAAIFGSLDTETLINRILAKLTTTESSLGSDLDINIDALGSVLKAALNVQLNGGIAVDADFTIENLNVKLSAKLTNEQVTLPNIYEYQDVLNSEITLDVSLTLMTGLVDEQTQKREEVTTLEGKVALCLVDGAVSEIRAEFGEIAGYFDFSEKSLYLKVGTTKAKLNFNQADITGIAALSIEDGDDLIPETLPTPIKQFLTNLVIDGKMISTNAKLSLLDALIPVWAELDLSENLSVRAGLSLLGIDAEVAVNFSETPLEGLSEEEKEEYTDILKDTWSLIDGLLNERISANVSGTVYSYTEAYNEQNNIKYNFNATLDYDKGHTVNEDGETVPNAFPIHIEEGTLNEEGKREGVNFYIDSTLYLHLNLALEALKPTEDSLFLDLWLFDANPSTDANGVTTNGALTQDGELDVYIEVSKYKQYGENYPVYNDKGGIKLDSNNKTITATKEPLRLYAPVSEIMTLVSMVGAAADLHGLTFENSTELTKLASDIADLVDQLLISQYIPATKDQFTSLGKSLIPQILGVSLNDLLNSLLGSSEDEEAEDVNTEEVASDSEFKLSENYVNSITYGDDCLEIKLSSSLLFGEDAKDDLVLALTKTTVDGASYLSSISLENLYTDNDTQKLDLDLNLSYGDITHPADMSGFTNAEGLDTLVKALVNSATHKVDGEDKAYDLNHTYYLSGNITAKISVLSFINVSVTVNVKSLAVYIDPVTNDVYADVHVFFPKTTLAINADTDTYMSFKNDMVYIKRVTSSSTEYRIMTMNSFLADIMDQIVFITNLSSRISGYLTDIDMSGNSTEMGNDDFGKTFKYILSSYIYSDNANSASWRFTINNELLTDLVGMTMSKIPVTINAAKGVDGNYTLTGLDVASSGSPAEMTLVNGVVYLKLHGSFTYQNPHEVVNAGYENSAYNVAEEKAVDGYSWSELLGGDTSEEILKTVNWTRLLRETSGSTYLKYSGSNLHAGILKFEYSSDDTNTNFVEFGERQLVLYGSSSIYTRLTYPDANAVMPPIEVEDGTDKLVGVWDDSYTTISDDSGANIAMRARYNNVVIKYVSSQLLEGMIDYDSCVKNADGYYVYSKTYVYSDEEVVELSTLSDLNTYVFKGYYDYNTGEKITEVSLNSAHTIFVDWIGKTINVEYVSDLDISSETSDDGYYHLTNAVVYGEDDALLTPNVSASNVELLGWFIQNGESYVYIADAQALKDYFANTTITGDTVNCKLWAVWYSNVTVTITKSSKSWGTWSIGGNYTGGEYASNISSAIAQKVGMVRTAQVRYELNTSENHCSGDDAADKLNSNTWYKLDNNSFSKSGMTTLNLASYGGARVKVTFSINGTEVATAEHSNYKSK